MLFSDTLVSLSNSGRNMLAEVFRILLHLQSGRQLCKLRVYLCPPWLTEPLIASGELADICSYGVTRFGLLDILCGTQMQSVLQKFPSLELFHLSIEENDNEHTAQWWTEQISNRLRKLRNVLQMEIIGTSESDHPLLDRKCALPSNCTEPLGRSHVKNSSRV